MNKRRLRQAYRVCGDGSTKLMEVIDNDGTICDIYGVVMRRVDSRVLFHHPGMPVQSLEMYDDKHGTVLVTTDPLPPMESIMIKDTSDVTEFERALEAYEQESEGE